MKSREALEKLAQAVESIRTSDDWTKYLGVMSRFRTYSLNNQLMIASQCPEATRVAGFKAWKRLGRWVRKGEKGIRILAPMTRKVEDEESGESRRVIGGFRVVCVFDISQTDGEPLPSVDMPGTVTGSDELAADLFEQLANWARSEGIPVEVAPIHSGAHGTASRSGGITIREGNPPAHQLKTLCHELGHVMLGHLEPGAGGVHSLPHMEVEAESTAYVVTQALGVETGDYSFGYVAHWAGSREKVMESADRIRGVADRIMAAFEAGQSEECAA